MKDVQQKLKKAQGGHFPGGPGLPPNQTVGFPAGSAWQLTGPQPAAQVHAGRARDLTAEAEKLAEQGIDMVMPAARAKPASLALVNCAPRSAWSTTPLGHRPRQDLAICGAWMTRSASSLPLTPPR